VDRARGRPEGQRSGRGHRGGRVGVPHHAAEPGDRGGERALVEPLVGHPSPLVGGDAVAHQQQRRPVEGGLGEPVGRARHAGPARHDRDPRRAREQPERARHHAGRRLAVGQGEREVVRSADQVQVRPAAREPEQPSYTRSAQARCRSFSQLAGSHRFTLPK
jgi:hypothetical protein